MQKYTRVILALLFLFLIILTGPISQVQAAEVLGVHILHPGELSAAKQLLNDESTNDEWHYLTIPIGLGDLEKKTEWQAFFREAKKQHIIPIVRLTTRSENGSWIIPTKKDITDLIAFLSDLEWPTAERHIIVFNEVNHAKEWGNQINPASYAEILTFTANWAHSENKNYKVLPAAMDLDAPNGRTTMEAFTYLNEMYKTNQEVFAALDYWNSHSYPNPGFSSNPERTSKNSLRGFVHELAFVEDKTDKELRVFITETGWTVNRATSRRLESYYTYAMQHVWSDPRVVAVTPFVLQGAPGPFAGFSFLDGNGKPTLQYDAFKAALTRFKNNS